MKIYDNLKEMSLIQCIITLQTWYYRLNNQWNRLVRDNGAKYDWVRVPAVIFVLATLFLLAYIPTEALAVGTAESHNIWVAYTVGDVSFAHSVLRAISMVMYGDGGVIQGAYRLAALLGIIWLIVRGLFSKDGLNFGSGLFVILFYMCFFVPQSTLHIEDMQTKKFYTMDKIPLGVSASLSVASKIGKYLSDAYESVFIDVSSDNGLCSAGSMECNGYMGTLDLISKARTNLQNSAAYLAINQSLCNSKTEYSSCDIETSLLNYFRDCTIHKVTNPNERFSLKNVKSFSNNADTAYDMKFDSKRHTVNIYLGSGKTGMMTCKDAGTAIEDAFRNAKVKTTIFKLASPLHNMNPHDGGSVADGGTGFDNGTTTGANNTAVLQGMMGEALAGLGGSSADPYEYLKNVIIEPIIADGMRAGFIDQNMVAARISLDTALAQRDLQLAAESSMFATMIRPLSTFLEGFVLALTPIMPFIILISLNGFAICMKYLMVLLWIQLWAPALAICNMYVQSVAKENLEIALSGTDITSLAGISRATPIIQHWLAVGGMMGASVPVLTLFILSGSIYTFNTLATSIKGGDHFDEKAIQPDAMKRAAFINTSVGSYDISGGGSIENGTQSRYKMYSQQDLYQVGTQSAHAEAIEKGNQLIKTWGQAWSHTKNGQVSQSFIERSDKAWQASDAVGRNKAIGWLVNLARDNKVSLTDEQAGKILAGWQAQVGISGETGFKALGNGVTVEAGIKAAVAGDKSWTDSQTAILTHAITKSATDQETIAKIKNMQDSFNQSLASADQDVFTEGLLKNDMASVQDAHSQAQKAQDTYNKTRSSSSSSSSSKIMSSKDIAAQIIESKQFKDVDNWLVKNEDIYGDIARYAHNKGYSSNTTGIFAAAVEYAMDHKDDDARAQELAKVMRLGQIMTGYEQGAVENDLGVDLSDHSAGNRQGVENEVENGNKDIQGKIEVNNQKPGVEAKKKESESYLAEKEEEMQKKYNAAKAEQEKQEKIIRAAAEGGTKTSAETTKDTTPGTITSRNRNFAKKHAKGIEKLEKDMAEIFKHGAP